VAPQPESAKTVAAFEVRLPSRADRTEFLSVLRSAAEHEGMHVDAMSDDDLEQQARVSPALKMTVSAAVWRGKNDEEPIASAMDESDHLGQVWIAFHEGEDPALNSRFREAVMREVVRKWPDTLRLPIMPTGAIPLKRDLVQTPNGYIINPQESYKYETHDAGGRSR
jgi:hypothetical protein